MNISIPGAFAICFVAMAISNSFVSTAKVEANAAAAISCNAAKKAAIDKGNTNAIFCADYQEQK